MWWLQLILSWQDCNKARILVWRYWQRELREVFSIMWQLVDWCPDWLETGQLFHSVYGMTQAAKGWNDKVLKIILTSGVGSVFVGDLNTSQPSWRKWGQKMLCSEEVYFGLYWWYEKLVVLQLKQRVRIIRWSLYQTNGFVLQQKVDFQHVEFFRPVSRTLGWRILICICGQCGLFMLRSASKSLQIC